MPAKPPASVRFVLGLLPVLQDSQLTIAVAPARASELPQVVLGPADFRPTPDDARHHTGWVPVGHAGEAVVTVVYRDTAGMLLARDTLALPARPRWRWTVMFGLLPAADASAPHRWCRNCDGERRIPLRGPSTLPGFTSLSVTWFGYDPDAPPKPPA